jgi:predicted nucleotide-binding protein (sugar kinase/HSP70/actin superfamily)
MINERQRKKEDNDDKRFTRTVIHKFFVGISKKKSRERRDIYVYVFIMSNTEEEEKKRKKEEFTHITHTREEEEENVSQALVSFNSLICLIK